MELGAEGVGGDFLSGRSETLRQLKREVSPLGLRERESRLEYVA